MASDPDLRISLLTCGQLDAELSQLTPGRDEGTRIRLPIPAYLVQTGGQTILVDTGMPDSCYTGDPRAMAEPDEGDPPAFVPLGGAADSITGQLAALGLGVEDITLVVATHLHFDHCGGLAHFTHCPVLIQRAELEDARATGRTEDWRLPPGVQFQPIAGDHTLAPGVELVFSPGHTPGHQSLLITLPGGAAPLLFTVDAVYLQRLWERDELGAAADLTAARASMDHLRDLAGRTGAQVISGHDAAVWAALHHPPEYYG
jgi:N-acyl homoserine lactone hydrolase